MAFNCCWTAVVVQLLLATYVLSTEQNMTEEQQKAYLRRFGYLRDERPTATSDVRIQQLFTHPDQQFTSAVRNFQRFAGLNVTGTVDRRTVEMMSTPRCGVSDIQVMTRRPQLYSITPRDKWDKLHLTYRFLTYTPDLPRATVRRIFQQAFQMWTEVSALSFSETSGPADIEIVFASGYHGDDDPFDGPGREVAHAYFPGRALGGDAHFDEDETWTDHSYYGVNLLQVAVHELGHSLGLRHSHVQSAIMAPFYRGYRPNFSLHQDDIDRIRYLYGHGGSATPTTLSARRTTTPSHTTPSPLPPQTPGPTPPPSFCPLESFCRDLDAIDVINNTVHAFKGQFYARLSRQGAITDIRRIQDTWPQLPAPLDAVLSTNRYVYFFKGSEYWRCDKTAADTHSLTHRLMDEGFPGAPHNMDAAFVWTGNDRVYFIKGNSYYRYRGGYGVDPGYPRPLSVWRGVRGPVNDVLQYDGVTYFFSGDGYQAFDDSTLTAGETRSTTDLMQCCTTTRREISTDNVFADAFEYIRNILLRRQIGS